MQEPVAREGFEEKRSARRDRMIKGGRLVSGEVSLDCVVLDVSSVGARVFFSGPARAPGLATFHLPDGSIRPARRRWQRDGLAGYEFLHGAEAAAQPPALRPAGAGDPRSRVHGAPDRARRTGLPMAEAGAAWQLAPMQRPALSQQVTFLYAEAPEASWRFFEEVMGLALVQDQGSCRIYAAEPAGRGFLGVCRARGARVAENPRVEGGVVFTFVTPEVERWRDFLAAKGVAVPDAVAYSEAYRVTHFFFRDPAGYLLEVQRFEREDWPVPQPDA